MDKSKKNSGKGMKPIIGYNPKNWYNRYDYINWTNKKKDKNNERIDGRTEKVSGSNGQ